VILDSLERGVEYLFTVTSVESDGYLSSSDTLMFITEAESVVSIPRGAGGFKVSCNFPSPFSQGTGCRIFLPASGRILARLYSLSGRKICTLMDERLPAGEHALIWDGRLKDHTPAGSGMYFCLISCETADGRRSVVHQKWIKIK